MREFDAIPTRARVYLAALTQRRGPFAVAEGIPDLRARLGGQRLEAAALADYRAACGARAAVPLGYPQMLITPLHVALLTDDAFPMRAMGLVHPRFSITQQRPLELGEALVFETWFDGLREVRNGVEFDIETRAFVDGELVWQSTAATFHRTGHARGGAPDDDLDALTRRRPFIVPADAGRRYARVSGDYNPVHLHPLASKLFGFSRPIAHGWWLVARCLAELGEECPPGPTRLEFEFRRPVTLGGSFELAATPDGREFAVLDAQGKIRLHGRAEEAGVTGRETR